MAANAVILLVEDNRDDEELAIRALKKQPVPSEVVVARTGEDAIDLLLGTGARARDGRIVPRVVLLDLNLPKMNGLDVLQRIRAEALTRHVPVVVLTSSKEEEDVLESYARGANAYVRKPVDYGQFTEAVRTMGRFWLTLNELPPVSSE